jgi:4'-phosphopantetheinyl transferase
LKDWPAIGWPIPERLPQWSKGEVQVWLAALDLAEPVLRALESVLSSDERRRAERFLLDETRRRFIAARGQLRQLLGQYLERDPQRLEIRYGAYGKPYLTGIAGAVLPHFSVTHCRNFALYALSCEREVGVDIEYIDQTLETEPLEEYFLTRRERDELRALDPSQQRLAFFTYWARKEAYSKGRGYGLRLDPRGFCVLAAGQEPVCLQEANGAGVATRRWVIRDLAVSRNHVGAVAAHGPSAWRPRCWCYPQWLNAKQEQAEFRPAGLPRPPVLRPDGG